MKLLEWTLYLSTASCKQDVRARAVKKLATDTIAVGRPPLFVPSSHLLLFLEAALTTQVHNTKKVDSGMYSSNGVYVAVLFVYS